MRAFIKKHRIEDLYLCIEKVHERTCSFDELCIGEQFRYILQTPSVIFLMIFDGTISSTIGERLLKTAAETAIASDASSGQYMIPMRMIPKIVQDSLDMKELLSKRLPCLTEKFDQWIKSLPARAGLISTIELALRTNAFLLKLMENFCSDTAKIPEETLLGLWNEWERDQLEQIRVYTRSVLKTP